MNTALTAIRDRLLEVTAAANSLTAADPDSPHLTRLYALALEDIGELVLDALETPPPPTPPPLPEHVYSACPNCGRAEFRQTYDIGSGPELSCASCEWCWGAREQALSPIPIPIPERADESEHGR
jgi:hypothetical protein